MNTSAPRSTRPIRTTPKRRRASSAQPAKPSATPSLSTNGVGFWFDRQTHRYIPITDHAIDATASPARFRLTHVDPESKALILMYHMHPRTEEAREVIIKLVAARNFIRVRWIPRQATLGWQFCGNPYGALDTLQRFARKHEIGPAALVTFTDFSIGCSVTSPLRDIDAFRDLCRRWEASRS